MSRPQPAKSCRVTGMDKYSYLRVIGPLRSVPGVITHTFQVRKVLYMTIKVQASQMLAGG